MNRLDAINGLTAFGALTIIPNTLLAKNQPKKTIHFIGLGGAGCNILAHIQKKGIDAKYICINNNERQGLTENIKFIKFTPPGESHYKNGMEIIRFSDMDIKLVIPTEINKVVKEDESYVLLAGLGGYTGTYMAEELTLFLNDNKKNFFTICSLPFAFEKKERFMQTV